jgi:hypothetical protein
MAAPRPRLIKEPIYSMIVTTAVLLGIGRLILLMKEPTNGRTVSG